MLASQFTVNNMLFHVGLFPKCRGNRQFIPMVAPWLQWWHHGSRYGTMAPVVAPWLQVWHNGSSDGTMAPVMAPSLQVWYHCSSDGTMVNLITSLIL